ncbi:MAG: DUF2089 domain-containing protein [Deinococcaceae bacterium]
MIFDLPTHFEGSEEKPIVTRVEFEMSGIRIEGRFRLNEFATLNREHLDFLRLYIRMRGNLKDVERHLGLSYPTVRARFEAMLSALETEPMVTKETTLSALERGEIGVEEAIRRLEH